MLDLRNLCKTYRGPKGSVSALADFSLAINSGEMVAVRGPSGSGKTTLLLIAGGLLRPDAGQVFLGDQDVYELSPGARARFRARNIGFVFQQFHLVPYLSVFDNVLTPTLAAGTSRAGIRAEELLQRFGLGERMDHVPAQLSTGERQRAALARALLPQPRLLLADEPTGNLDTANGEAVLASLAEFARAGGGVLLVTHDVRVAEFADRILDLAPALAGGRR